MSTLSYVLGGRFQKCLFSRYENWLLLLADEELLD